MGSTALKVCEFIKYADEKYKEIASKAGISPKNTDIPIIRKTMVKRKL